MDDMFIMSVFEGKFAGFEATKCPYLVPDCSTWKPQV